MPVQFLSWAGQTIALSNVKAAVIEMNGAEVLRVERDLAALPFDVNNLAHTVDEPTFALLSDLTLREGAIEVQVLSRLQDPLPFARAQGFIGLAFRVNETRTAFESIYLRPKSGRSDDQLARNRTVQYFAYPDFKFNRLRQEAPGGYETYADIGLDEWITLRLEFTGKRARLYVNEQRHPAFVVNDLKSTSEVGSIGLWVNIGTEGYFKRWRVL